MTASVANNAKTMRAGPCAPRSDTVIALALLAALIVGWLGNLVEPGNLATSISGIWKSVQARQV